MNVCMYVLHYSSASMCKGINLSNERKTATVWCRTVLSFEKKSTVCLHAVLLLFTFYFGAAFSNTRYRLPLAAMMTGCSTRRPVHVNKINES